MKPIGEGFRYVVQDGPESEPNETDQTATSRAAKKRVETLTQLRYIITRMHLAARIRLALRTGPVRSQMADRAQNSSTEPGRPCRIDLHLNNSIPDRNPLPTSDG